MIQRIQSLYLAAVCIAMATFLNLGIWMKATLDRFCIIKPYALILSTDQCVIFPYGCCALCACYLIVMAAYAIIRHDNRKLQLHLTTHISLTLIILIGLIWVLVTKTNQAYFPNGSSSYKIGMLLPCIALVANLLARYYIQKDVQLVSQDRLR